MPYIDFPTELNKRTVNFEALADLVIENPTLLNRLFEGLKVKNAKVKFGSMKILRILAEKQPTILYSEFDRLVQLMDGDNSILKWGATLCIADLAIIDMEGKIDSILDHYLAPITGPAMITAANVIKGAGSIAQAKPRSAEKIMNAFFRVEKATYQTTECRNVAIGHTIDSFDQFYRCLTDPKPVLEFVQRHVNNPRKAVQNKAKRFLSQKTA